MNSPAASPDRGSTLVLIDDVGSSTAERSTTSQGMSSTTAQSSNNSSLRTGMPPSSAHHPPDPLLYGLQTMEWRPWLRPTPGSSSTIDDYTKSPAANDEYSNYASKTTKSVHFHDDCHPVLDMHGVGPCRRSLYWWAKIFWTLILLAATAGLSFEVYKTVDEFWWNGPNSGSYSIAQGSPGASVPFPDVYLCPSNPVNETYRRRRRTDMKWFQILSALNQKANPEGILGKLLVNWDYFPQQASVIAGPPSTNISALGWPSGSAEPQPIPAFLEDIPNDPAPSPLNIDSMREYFMRNGYEMDSFLNECSFRSKSFKCSEIAQSTLDRKHGKCFHFPFSSGATAWPHSFSTLSPSNAMANASWRVTNGAQGFSLAMNIHTELYPKENGSLFDGAYLYVDWRFDPASSMYSKPILLPPGAYSSITLESKEIRVRKLDPYCIEDESPEGHRDRHNWMVLNSPRYYRQDLCKFDCILQSIIDICHCLLLIDGRYVNRSALVLERRLGGNDSDPFTFSQTTWSTVGYCTSEQLSECAFDILQQYDSPTPNDFNNNNCSRRCRPSCRRREYNVLSNSYLKLPAESYLGSGPNYPFPWNELKNNYVIVDIVIERGQTTVVEEGPLMNLETFLGILGGQMSLFLGCSLLTIVQILVLFLSCCKTACQSVYRGKCLTFRKTLRKMRHSSLLK